jgi:hypothetical protein
MPPTGRRRRNKEPEQRADAEAAEAATPSRKRRRVRADLVHARILGQVADEIQVGPKDGAKDARAIRRASAESDATIENADGDENGAEEPEINEVDAIIQKLRCAPYQVGVAIDYNNAIVPPNEAAFAKIAGRNWTYYVKTTNVVIGRPNAKTKRESTAGEVTGTPVGDDVMGLMVNIDLGPDQQISRIHAEIIYDSEAEHWYVICNGRNGFSLDERRIERGQQCVLRSGAVLSILGTQMIFILPNQPAEIAESVRRSLLEDADADDERYEPGDGVLRGFNVRYGGQQQNSQQPGSSSRPAGGSGTQAAQMLAALSTSQQAPGTPRVHPPQPKSKNSPAYVKGVMLDTTEEIDYSADSAKDIKPPHSYAQMIGQAIMSREGENATLAQIYEFIKEHYAFFRINGGGWQNSIRHNLSLSKAFEKIPRRTDEPGKGMKWQIVEEFREEYMKKNFHDNRRPTQRRLGSSGPNSPAPATAGPGAQTERLVGALNGNAYSKHLSGSPTPPRHAYPAPNESFTPDRGPRGMQLQTIQMPSTNGAAPMSATSEFLTPTFERNNPLASQQTFSAGSRHSDNMQGLAIDSPPPLTGNPDAVGHGIVHTPLPARTAPPKAFPSTVKPPSFYVKDLFSSPAPFWKYTDVVGSTPLRPMLDLSPEKFAKPAIVDDEIKTSYDHDDLDTKFEKKEEEDEKLGVLKDEDAKPEVGEALEEQASTEPEAELTAPNEPEIIPPSSPLGNRAAALAPDDETEAPDESPTRTLSRPPSSRREPSIAAPSLANGMHNIAKLAPPPAQPQFNLRPMAGISAPGFRMYAGRGMEGDDEDEDEGIDLSK